jgi:chemotaxis signal transduction protein
MNEVSSGLGAQAALLRREFDSAFAEEARRDVTSMEDLLGFRVGAEPYALRLSEIVGLFADRKITRLPGSGVALLGISSFRGAIVPVYDLHVLLGRQTIETPRWLAIASGAPLALAFEAFDGHLQVPRENIVDQNANKQSQRLVRQFASHDGVVRPIVDLLSVIDAISTQLPRANIAEER